MAIHKIGNVSHTLPFIDSSSALGWMHKASFDPVNKEGHYMGSRWLGRNLFSNEVSLYCQHSKGTKNIIAESLSRDFHISDQSLTNIFNSILSPQTVSSFHIKFSPRKIISWILSLAESSTQPEDSPKPLQPSSMETGTYDAHSSHKQSPIINSYMESHKDTKQSWCSHSHYHCKETSLAQ